MVLPSLQMLISLLEQNLQIRNTDYNYHEEDSISQSLDFL